MSVCIFVFVETNERYENQHPSHHREHDFY